MAVTLPRGTRFQHVVEPIKRYRIITLVEGLQKDGKTHFAFTAPGPIAYMDIDKGDEGVMDKFLELGKEIHKGGYQTPKAEPGEDVNIQIAAVAEVKAFQNDYYAALKGGIRTIIWDTETELWELVQLAEFGKLTQNNKYGYRGINSMMRNMIRAALDSDVNLIMLRRMAKEYKDDKWSGGYEGKGFGGAVYDTQLILRTSRCEGDCDEDHHSEGDTSFHIKVVDCRHTPELNNKDFAAPENEFAYIAARVFGNEVTDWMD